MGSCMTDKCREGFDKWWNDVGAEAYAPCEVLNYPEEQAYAMWQAGAKWQAAQDLPNKHTAEKLPTRDTDAVRPVPAPKYRFPCLPYDDEVTLPSPEPAPSSIGHYTSTPQDHTE